MKKKLATAVLGVALTSSVGITALAAGWQKDRVGWKYQGEDGRYLTRCWEWIDSNHDGIGERYYFNESGFMLENTTAPDGSKVNSSGAWTVGGVVQTKNMDAGVQEAPSVPAASAEAQVTPSVPETGAEAPGAQATPSVSESVPEANAQTADVQATPSAQYDDDYSGIYMIPDWETQGRTSHALSIVYDKATNSMMVSWPHLGTAGTTYTYFGPGYKGYTVFELVTDEEKDAIFFSAPGVIAWSDDVFVSRN